MWIDEKILEVLVRFAYVGFVAIILLIFFTIGTLLGG